MADQLEFNRLTAFDSEGDPVSGAKAYFYETGTLTPLTVYSDEALSVAHASPLVADSSGVFAPVYYGGSTAVKVVVTTSADASLYTTDPVRRVAGSASSAAGVTFAPTSEIPSTNVQAAIERVQQNATLNFNVISKTANYTVISTDKSNLIRCTATLTLALTAASTLGDGFTFTVEASGATVTIDPNASETINGAATLVVNDGEFASVFCNGTAFFAAIYPAPTALATALAISTDTYTARTGLTTVIPVDGTPPTSSEGTEILSIASVVVATGQKVRVDFSCFAGASTAGDFGTFALFRDTTCIFATGFEQSAGVNLYPISFSVIDEPSAGTYTYSLRAGPSANTLYVNADFAGTNLYDTAAKAVLGVSVR